MSLSKNNLYLISFLCTVSLKAKTLSVMRATRGSWASKLVCSRVLLLHPRVLITIHLLLLLIPRPGKRILTTGQVKNWVKVDQACRCLAHEHPKILRVHPLLVVVTIGDEGGVPSLFGLYSALALIDSLLDVAKVGVHGL